MITMADLARAFGVSRPTILRDVRNGCPLSSVADALAWRAGRGMKVPPNMRHQELKARKRSEPVSGGPSLVLSNSSALAPLAPKKGAVRWMLDHWLGSFPQRCLQYALCGPTNENR